jgi:hypothetical protein
MYTEIALPVRAHTSLVRTSTQHSAHSTQHTNSYDFELVLGARDDGDGRRHKVLWGGGGKEG